MPGIWIRSQDKKILKKCVDINAGSYNGKTVIFGLSNEISITQMPTILGTYATEERALQVLDEIQQQIKGIEYLQLLSHSRDFLVRDFKNEELIYQMPED